MQSAYFNVFHRIAYTNVCTMCLCSLQKCRIGPEGMFSLARALQQRPKVEELE